MTNAPQPRWTTPNDLQDQIARLWTRGDLLRATVDDAALHWPLRLSLKAPSSSDLAEHFEAVRAWVNQLQSLDRIHLEWREVVHRVQGRQRLPSAAWISTLDDALILVGQSAAAVRFQGLWAQAAAIDPALLSWLRQRPLQALDLDTEWTRLLAVVRWVQQHPRPGCYLREVDIPGVDSKFIERHRGVLTEWLDLSLPADAVDTNATGVAQFAQRFGFRDKPQRIRFRLLASGLLADLPSSDVTLDANSFAGLKLPVSQVFITENETNFLAFPPVAQAIVIFGAGYGWQALATANWLKAGELYYWGDIDTHGFAILDQLRGYFPHTQSLLMDRDTLLAHRSHWTEEPQPARHDLGRLTPSEATLYDDLRTNRLASRLRLEQERVGFAWLSGRLSVVIGHDQSWSTD